MELMTSSDDFGDIFSVVYHSEKRAVELIIEDLIDGQSMSIQTVNIRRVESLISALQQARQRMTEAGE